MDQSQHFRDKIPVKGMESTRWTNFEEGKQDFISRQGYGHYFWDSYAIIFIDYSQHKKMLFFNLKKRLAGNTFSSYVEIIEVVDEYFNNLYKSYFTDEIKKIGLFYHKRFWFLSHSGNIPIHPRIIAIIANDTSVLTADYTIREATRKLQSSDLNITNVREEIKKFAGKQEEKLHGRVWINDITRRLKRMKPLQCENYRFNAKLSKHHWATLTLVNR